MFVRNPMVNFIYLAHSKERYRKQTVFSVLTLLEYTWQSSLKHRVVVYTDEPEYFEPLEVEIVRVSDDTLNEWKGEIDFVHRMKICLLIDAFGRFEGRMVLLDSDNCFFKDPTELIRAWKSDTVLMSSWEYRLGKPADLVGKKYKRFFKRNAHFSGVTTDYTVSENLQCWNAGVVGLPESAEIYLKDVLMLCDAMHQRFRKHLSEQMAFNIVMGEHYRLDGISEFSYHWFGHGQAINKIIDSVLLKYPNEKLDELIERVSASKKDVLNAPLNPDKQPWYKRLFSRL